MKKNHIKLLIIAVIIIIIGAFYILVPDKYLSLSYIKLKHSFLVSFYNDNRFLSVGIYMAAYIIMAALSLPGAAVMSLAGASVFGFITGLVAISFASSIGALLAFLGARFMFGDIVQKKYSDKLKKINEGIKKDGAFYLFTLRLIPVFPFFIINLAMGLTPIRAFTYYIVSQIGMLPGTAVYVYAGTKLGELSSTKGIFSPSLILAFVLLGVFPWIAKFTIGLIKSRSILKAYKKPKKFDYNLVVIGAGAAGLVSSYIAAMVKSKVCLIEKDKMGGDCLNTGCVPSKALIKSAKILSYKNYYSKFGISKIDIDYKFEDIIKRVKNIIKKIEPNDSIKRYESLGVECIKGKAEIISPYEVKVDNRILKTKKIIVATGASPYIPGIKGLDKINYLTSDNLWELEALPKKFVILGGGPIGCELAQAFNRLGSKVSIIEMSDHLMIREDNDVQEIIEKRFIKEGINICTSHTAKEIIQEDHKKYILTKNREKEVKIEFDEILVAVGRKANTKGFGLENLDIELNENGTVKVNEYLQTNIPTIYCAGDVAGPYQFTHTASHQAWFASVNSLFGTFKRFKADYSIIPFATYTDPEVARVGINEKEAKSKNIDYDKTTYSLTDLDRAITDSVDYGFVKVLTKKDTDKIIGAVIVGENASSIITEFILAMKYNLGLNKILSTIHIYPTFSEANKFAAGEWKKNRKPEKVLNILKKYHKFMRG